MRSSILMHEEELCWPKYHCAEGDLLITVGDEVTIWCQDDPTFYAKVGIVKVLSTQKDVVFVEMLTGGGIWWRADVLCPTPKLCGIIL